MAVALAVCAPESGASSRPGALQSVLPSRAKPTPVRAVTAPARVGVALAKTQQARYLAVTERSQGGTVRYVIDSRHGRAETWAGRKVSLIQIGREVYARAAKGGCYVSAKRPSALLPNVAGMLLPSGVAAFRYTTTGRTIRWSIKTAGKYQPHGTVVVNAAGRIVSATIHSGPGVPLVAAVSYPATLSAIAAPAKLC